MSKPNKSLNMKGGLLPFDDEIVYQMAQVNFSASKYMTQTYGRLYPRLYEINDDMTKREKYPMVETSEEARMFIKAKTQFVLSPEMTTLDLSHMNLKSLPDWFPSIILYKSKLLEINLSNNNLSSLPDAFCSSFGTSQVGEYNFGKSQITSLNLENNELTSLPQCIKRMKALQYLNVRHNQLSFLPQTMADMINLHVLLIKGNSISRRLPKIPNLAVLD